MKIDNIKTPHLGCLHPIKIVKDGVERLVPCGHCAACYIARSNVLTQACNLEDFDNPYCLFVTLTYSDDYVPRFKVCSLTGEEIELVNSHDKFNGINCKLILDRRTPLRTDSLDFDAGDSYFYNRLTSETLSFVQEKQGYTDEPFINGVYKPDIQRFIKRLNYYLNYGKENKTTLRYFVGAEYGPLHFRPHYHLLLWFGNKFIADECFSCIHKAWKFGRTDIQFSNGGSSSYTAGYVNSFACLPEDFRNLYGIRPFSSKSVRLGFGFLKGQSASVYASEEKSSTELDSTLRKMWTKRREYGVSETSTFTNIEFNRDGGYSEVFFYRYVKDWYFPRTLGYDRKDRQSVKEDFLHISYAKKYLGENFSSNIAESAREIFRLIHEYWEQIILISRTHSYPHYDGKRRYIIHYCPDDGIVYWLANILSAYSDNDLRDNVSFAQSSFEDWLFVPHKTYNRAKLLVFERDNGTVLLDTIYRLLSISRHFVDDICGGDLSQVDKYLDIITSYYARQEADYYNDIISLMTDNDSISDDFMLQLYPDTFNLQVYQNTREFYWYSNNINNRVNNRVKHKQMNDSFDIFTNIKK